MLFYLLLFLVSAFLVNFGNHCKKSQRFLIVAIGIMLPVIVATLRGENVGKDTLEYTSMFNSFMSLEGFQGILTVINTELFFVITCIIAKYTFGIPVVFFCYSFLTILFAYLAVVKYRREAPVWLGFLLFLFFFYSSSLNIMRQMLAGAYMLYASTFLLEGKKKKFILMAGLSVLFHLTALVAAAIIYVIFRLANVERRKRKVAYMMFYLALIAGFLMVDVMMRYLGSAGFDKGAAYTSDSTIGGSQISVTDVLYSICLIAVSYEAMKKMWVRKINPNFFFLASVTCIVLFCTGYYNQWLSRMAYYMLAFACLYLPLIAMSPKLKRYRSISKLAIFCFGFAYWFYLFVIAGSNLTIPYYTNSGIYFDF
ncbi:MAG: EpsG family protein [Muribaculaceae bacterium]|nr:EpsG family protein [Muribaculaceae bacterium]